MIKEEVIADEPQEVSAIDIIPAVARPEVNLLRFPFFSLRRRGLRQENEIVYRATEVRNGQKAEFEWRVIGSGKYGLPNFFDRKVARAIDAIIDKTIERNGYIENPVRFSLYRVAKLIGLRPRGGKVYRDIRESLTRVTLTGVESKGAFFVKDEKKWLHDVFHPYRRVVFVGTEMPDGTIAETNYLWLGDPYLQNINARYTRPLDYTYLNSLKSDVAGRLYEVLSSKFYGLRDHQSYCRFEYPDLCQTLPITQQRYYKRARATLDPAHEELMETGYLAKVVYQLYKGRQELKSIKYYIGPRARKEKRKHWARLDPIEEILVLPTDKEKESQLSQIAQELHRRGISKKVSVELAEFFPEDYLQERIVVHDEMKAAGELTKNAAGFLRSSIEEIYEVSDEQRQKVQAKARHKEREEKDANRLQRWKEEREKRIKQDLQNWDKISPEERVERSGLFPSWLKFHHVDPDSEEAQAKRQELIDRLPKTEAERRRYLEEKVHTHTPPEDFK